MFKFRGQRKDNGEWVVGNLVDDGDTYIIWGDELGDEVHPTSLSISIGKLDSNKEEIFASYPVGGVTSMGGDVVEILFGVRMGKRCNVYYSISDSQFLVSRIDKDMIYELNSFYSIDLTIIGKQEVKSE